MRNSKSDHLLFKYSLFSKMAYFLPSNYPRAILRGHDAPVVDACIESDLDTCITAGKDECCILHSIRLKFIILINNLDKKRQIYT